MDLNDAFRRHLNRGPLQAHREGADRLSVRVTLPVDEHGYLERSCADPECEPKLFKVRGEPRADEDRCCPYCGKAGDGNSFATTEQVRYAHELLTRQAGDAIHDAMYDEMKRAFRLDSRGRRKIGGGLFSMEMSVERHRQWQPPVQQPRSERPRRDVKCGQCGSEHIVFGLATWCHTCTTDIFDAHLAAEMADIRALLQDAVSRRSELSARLFARQAENVLEDLVSAWEAALRHLQGRFLLAQGKKRSEVDQFIQKTVRNQFQGLDRSAELLREHIGVEAFKDVPPNELARAGGLFAARHAIAHCLGVTDRKLLSKAGSGHVGRELDLDPADLQWLAAFLETRLRAVWSVAFPKKQGPVKEGEADAP